MVLRQLVVTYTVSPGGSGEGGGVGGTGDGGGSGGDGGSVCADVKLLASRAKAEVRRTIVHRCRPWTGGCSVQQAPCRI